jgi:hypothetical protein
MLTEKEILLVRSIYEKSELGVLDWERTAIDDVFQVSFSASSIEIAGNETGEFDQQVFRLNIYNERGDIIKSFPEDELYRDFENGHNYLEKIYTLARSKALKIDEAIDNILEDLNNLDLPF